MTCFVKGRNIAAPTSASPMRFIMCFEIVIADKRAVASGYPAHIILFFGMVFHVSLKVVATFETFFAS